MAKALLQLLSVVGLVAARQWRRFHALISAVIRACGWFAALGDSAIRFAAQEH